MNEDLQTRSSLEARELKWLAPYAIKSASSRGRVYPEKEHDFRTAFQRDRDRIVHSTAFRRLEYKTQVFVNHEGDHYRTRLTHTIETTQIARTIGRILGLNEDLIEAIALAHDLGHGPFGHAGQETLAKLMKNRGGFEHNCQALRIVEELEESYAGFPGLNLTYEVREGLRKHAANRFRFLESEVVDHADEIAYHCHDLDDGVRAGLLALGDIEKVRLLRETYEYVEARAGRANDLIKHRMMIRLLINRMVNDLVNETKRKLCILGIESARDVAKQKRPVVDFSREMKSKTAEMRRFLWKRLYNHPRVTAKTKEGQRYIIQLFKAYVDGKTKLPRQILHRSKKDGLERAVCDYIAGMTDRYALDEFGRLSCSGRKKKI